MVLKQKLTETSLHLDSLEIQGFRAFHHLQIERLGRVNLIVGKNNVGKSSLLEALWLYSHKGSPRTIWDILKTRGESQSDSPKNSVDVEEQSLAIGALFYGRIDVRRQNGAISIGPIGSEHRTLHVSVDWYTNQGDEEGNEHWQLLHPDEEKDDNVMLRLATRIGERPRLSYPLYQNSIPLSVWVRRSERSEFREIPSMYKPAMGLDKRDISRLWDKTTLTPGEQHLLDALTILSPTVEGLRMVGDPQRPYERIPIVKIREISVPIPLYSMGEGMSRMFDIALAMANAQNGMVFIDEVENGIHYSVQPDLWKLIFDVAYELNTQVFATTHSWDCVEAFQRIAGRDDQEGLLIRLEEQKGQIAATLFDERELAIATRNEIEVR